MNLAPTYKRVIAFIIDSLFILSLTTIVAILFKDRIDWTALNEAQNIFNNGEIDFSYFLSLVYAASTSWTFILFSCWLGFVIVYFIIMPIVWKKQTFGRLIMKIKVVKLNGTKLSFGTLFLREIIGKYILCFFSFGIVAIISIVLCFVAKGRRSIHDRMSNTLVVCSNLATTAIEENEHKGE